MRSETAPTRQVVAAAIVLLALGAAGAMQAGQAGLTFMSDLELERPPLARIAPVIDPTPTPRLARRVFLVIVDGLRLDKSYELPFFDELRRRGVDTEAVSHFPSLSRPNYVSILAGVPPTASGVRTNYHATPVTLDTLMDRAHAAGLRVATATDYALLPSLFLRPRHPSPPTDDDPRDREPGPFELEASDDRGDLIDAIEDPGPHAGVAPPDADLTSPFDDSRFTPWPGGFREAATSLVAGNADLVVLLISAPDVAGHAYGAASPKYREAAAASDRALAEVLSRVDLSHDAVLVTADHGHTNRGGHGGVEPEVMSVPLIAAGAGIRRGATSADARLIDVAPTVATLLGIAAPGHGLGRTLTELLVLDEEARLQRDAADQRRITTTRGVVEVAEVRAELATLEDRATRIALVAGGAALAVVLAVLLIRRRVLRLDLRVLVVSVPAFFVVYFVLIGVAGGFSPSLVPARGHIASVLIRYGLAGMLVQLVANMYMLHGWPRFGDRLAAANGVSWAGLMLTMVPAGLLWAFFPPPYVTLPGPVWTVVIPAVEVAVACAAVNVALTLLVEVIVFAARALHRDLRALG